MAKELSSVSERPLVSIIVPTYNCGPFIGQTLESVQAQTYPNWECLIVDDDSTDETREVVARYARNDRRIKYYYKEKQGVSAARNYGLERSAGQYIQFLDADDLIEKKKFERQVDYLEQHPEVDIVYGSVRYFRTENVEERKYSMSEENKPWMPEVSGAGEDILLALSGGNIMAVNSPLIRRSVIDDVGLFDEAVPPLEDWDYWIRCATQGKRFQYEDFEGTLALVRSHPSSSSKNKQRMITARSLIKKKLMEATAHADIKKINRGIAAQVEGWFGIDEVANGSLIRGMGHLFKAGTMGGKMKWRMKWFLCGLVAPFVPRQWFEKVATTSFTQTVGNFSRKQQFSPRKFRR